jgi:hypothetical protein
MREGPKAIEVGVSALPAHSGALAAGAVASLALAAAAGRRAAVRCVSVQVAKGAPSLIQVLEQKNLLSFAQNNRLLSQAEKAGLGIQTVEELGLLKLLDRLKLLTLAETLVTNPSTATTLLLGSIVLGGLAFVLATTGEVGFLQSVLVGAFGAPALVLFGAAVVIFGLTSGTRRSRPLTRSDKVVVYNDPGFVTTSVTEDVTLIQSLEKRNVLSYLEENRLLGLAASLVNQPLTLTENLGILPQIERQQVLSFVESTAADKFGPVKVGLPGLVLLPAAAAAFFLLPDIANILVAGALGLGGIAFIAVGGGIALAAPPTRFVR